MSTVSPSQASPGEEITASKVNTPVNQLATVINGQLDDNNISSVSGTKLVAGTTPATAFSDAVKGGWIDGVLTAPATTTYNGNGSYTWTYASSVAAYIAPFTRIRTLRATTAPTYMLTLNGSNQYATKATPSGSLGTVTNNFSVVGWIYPTSYPAFGTIASRMDATGANGFAFEMYNSSGQLRMLVQNGGAANYRFIQTNQSVQLNKKQFVVGTWSSGTLTVYLNGVSIPVASTPTTSGTAPTTAGTGGDFSIGRQGASGAGYFPGSISGVQVYDKVLSAAEVQALYSQGATGAETNCIGSWDLNNRATDQNAAGNNLTLTNSPTYTSGRAPFATDSSGVAGGSYDYGMVTSLSTDGKTVTLQVPEGCAFPTGASAISSVAYSSQNAPLNFPLDKGRWEISLIFATSLLSASATTGTPQNIGALTAPLFKLMPGSWLGSLKGTVRAVGSTVADKEYHIGLSPTSATMPSIGSDIAKMVCSNFISALEIRAMSSVSGVPVTVSSATDYYLVGTFNGTGVLSTFGFYVSGGYAPAEIKFVPAGI